MSPSSQSPDPIAGIVASYDDTITRAYSRVRFVILRQSFLEEVGQYLPKEGRVLDIGCGFGLFSLYFATTRPDLEILGIDQDGRRIALARESAGKLGLENVDYRVADARSLPPDGSYDAIYMLDLLHHLPRADVPEFLAEVRSRLREGGVLIVKDVEDRPAWKRWFTLVLDRLMVGWAPGAVAGRPGTGRLFRGGRGAGLIRVRGKARRMGRSRRHVPARRGALRGRWRVAWAVDRSGRPSG